MAGATTTKTGKKHISILHNQIVITDITKYCRNQRFVLQDLFCFCKVRPSQFYLYFTLPEQNFSLCGKYTSFQHFSESVGNSFEHFGSLYSEWSHSEAPFFLSVCKGQNEINLSVNIVVCQRGRVSEEPPWLRVATRHGPVTLQSV